MHVILASIDCRVIQEKEGENKPSHLPVLILILLLPPFRVRRFVAEIFFEKSKCATLVDSQFDKQQQYITGGVLPQKAIISYIKASCVDTLLPFFSVRYLVRRLAFTVIYAAVPLATDSLRCVARTIDAIFPRFP